jgi:hypothetical protein
MSKPKSGAKKTKSFEQYKFDSRVDMQKYKALKNSHAELMGAVVGLMLKTNENLQTVREMLKRAEKLQVSK